MPCKTSLSLLLVGVCLSACTARHAAYPLPTGYAYHKNYSYESTPAATPQSIGHPYSEQESLESGAHWRAAAHDLLIKMSQDIGPLPTAIYVKPALRETPFNALFDNFVRETLITLGYRITTAPDATYVLRYSSAVLDHRATRDPRPHPAAVRGEAYRWSDSVQRWESAPLLPKSTSELVLSVSLSAGAEILNEQTGVYYIQTHDIGQYSGPLFNMLPVVGDRTAMPMGR